MMELIMELGRRYDVLDAKGRDRTPDEQEEYAMLREAYGGTETEGEKTEGPLVDKIKLALNSIYGKKG